jgi:GDP-mannose 6-dehydrogenase
MRVSVFGLGYVGTVTAACLAKAGHHVVGIDVDPEKVSLVNAGQSPIVEPGLASLLAEVVGAQRLRATMSAEEAVEISDIALICVGTPGQGVGQQDLRALRRVAEEIGAAIGKCAKPYTVVLRSTVLPGTTERVLLPALRATAAQLAGPQIRLAVNPEFMREGSSLRDFFAPPFTLVGTDDTSAADPLRSLYASVEAPFVRASVRTAEMIKYVCNAFHALKVCFANEIGDLCAAFGADAREVTDLFLMDRKLNISEAYLRPGFAFGGSCLPKDVRALVSAASAADVVVPLLAAIMPSNDGQIRHGIEAVLATRKRRVGVIGLSFKTGTDDLRESPLVRLIEGLIGKGCDVRILDSSVSLARLKGANRRYIEEEIPHIASLLCESVDRLLQHAEVLVIGNGGKEAAAALAAVRPDAIVVDLTRSMASGPRAGA